MESIEKALLKYFDNDVTAATNIDNPGELYIPYSLLDPLTKGYGVVIKSTTSNSSSTFGYKWKIPGSDNSYSVGISHTGKIESNSRQGNTVSPGSRQFAGVLNKVNVYVDDKSTLSFIINDKFKAYSDILIPRHAVAWIYARNCNVDLLNGIKNPDNSELYEVHLAGKSTADTPCISGCYTDVKAPLGRKRCDTYPHGLGGTSKTDQCDDAYDNLSASKRKAIVKQKKKSYETAREVRRNANRAAQRLGSQLTIQ